MVGEMPSRLQRRCHPLESLEQIRNGITRQPRREALQATCIKPLLGKFRRGEMVDALGLEPRTR
jgi:hypothetical protein